MDAEAARDAVAQIHAGDRAQQGAAYQRLLGATAHTVTWAYDVWDRLVAALGSDDNRLRSIASQILANLAAHSDPDGRIVTDFDALAAVTRDARFVTARHALQSLWKVSLGGAEQLHLVLDHLATRFHDCAQEKNCGLIRQDIVVALASIERVSGAQSGGSVAEELIASEPDATCRRKYRSARRRELG